MRLAAAGWLACSNDPRNYAGRSLMLLAGPTKPDRSLGKGPDEACIPVLQARGFGSGLAIRNCKKKKKKDKKRPCYGNSNDDMSFVANLYASWRDG